MVQNQPNPKENGMRLTKKIAQLNTKAINILYYTLDANEFNHISTCISAKKIQDRLEVTHGGNNQVKKLKKLTCLCTNMNSLKWSMMNQ